MTNETNDSLKIFLIFFFALTFCARGFALSETKENSQQQSTAYQKFQLFYDWSATYACDEIRWGSDPAHWNRGADPYHVCTDGSVSYDQPNSQGPLGWEGYCGQVAVSNITGMFCQRMIAPKNIDFYATDSFPGSLPSTLTTILTQIFAEKNGVMRCPNGEWKTSTSELSQTFISNLKKLLFQTNQKSVIQRKRSYESTIAVSPVIILLNEGVLAYHYVTLLDLIDNSYDSFGCSAVINTWGEQKLLSCENLINHTQNSALGFLAIYFDEHN
ncbi:MAG: hypothetical protein QE271_04690 [Bacteriovoracaceae bacterium]|nr:hypothetical protein [Bacteriovoracaceae bacterium]